MDRHTIIPLFEPSDNEDAKQYLHDNMSSIVFGSSSCYPSIQNIEKTYGINCWYVANYTKVYIYLIDNAIPTLFAHFNIRKRYFQVYKYNFISLSLEACKLLGICQDEIAKYFCNSSSYFEGRPSEFYPDNSIDWRTIERPEPDKYDMINTVLQYPLYHFTNIDFEILFRSDDIPLLEAICRCPNIISSNFKPDDIQNKVIPLLRQKNKRVRLIFKIFPSLDINGIHELVDLMLRYI